MKEKIQTDRAPKPRGPYSQGILAEGEMLFVAAQGPYDPATGAVVGETFREQAIRVFENIQAIVEAAGGSMEDVVRVTVYIADWKYFGELNEIYPRFFPEPLPARTPIQMNTGGGLIMADAIAVLPE